MQINFHSLLWSYLPRVQIFWSWLYKILKVAKAKVSNPKRYSLWKLRLGHAFLKRLIQRRPHKSTWLCWKICIRPPTCLCKESRRNFYSRSIVATAAMSCNYDKGCCVTFPSRAWGIRPITTHWTAGQAEHSVLFRAMSFVKINTFLKVGAERSNNNVWYMENNVFFF